VLLPSFFEAVPDDQVQFANVSNWCERQLRLWKSFHRERGVQFSSKIKPTCSSRGRGVVATQDIEQGEVLFYIPAEFVVNKKAVVTKGVTGYNEFELSMFLLREMGRANQGQHSTWKDTIRNLPDLSVGGQSPIFWSSSELDMLSHTFTKEMIVRKKQLLLERYQDYLLHESTLYSQNEFHVLNMHMNVLGRAFFDSASQPVMSPVSDFFNHAFENNVVVAVGHKEAVSKATKPILQGQELFINYGRRDVASFFFDYGFVGSGHMHFEDTIVVRGEVLTAAGEEMAVVLKTLMEPDDHVRELVQILCKLGMAIDATSPSSKLSQVHSDDAWPGFVKQIGHVGTEAAEILIAALKPEGIGSSGKTSLSWPQLQAAAVRETEAAVATKFRAFMLMVRDATLKSDSKYREVAEVLIDTTRVWLKQLLKKRHSKM